MPVKTGFLKKEKKVKSYDIEKYKSAIKKWVPDGCPCRLCKKYIFLG